MNLIDAIQALSLREKEELYSHIGQLIQEEKFYKEDEGVRKMEEIKMAVCAAMGVFTYDPTNRERQNVIVRVITANVLLEMGWSENSVGKAMRKNHSAIHYYKVTMDTWKQYPGVYKEELTIWNQIKQEYETDKRTI
jgi:hypothetical protein